MLAVERPETPKYKLCKGREGGGGGGGGGAINRVGAFITKNTVFYILQNRLWRPSF